MTADHDATQLKQEIEALSRRRGQKYPPALETRIIAYARSRRAQGATWDVISAEIDVPFETLRRWSLRESERSGSSAPELVPVRVVPEPLPERVVSLVSPAGFRIEGLALSEAVAVLRALS